MTTIAQGDLPDLDYPQTLNTSQKQDTKERSIASMKHDREVLKAGTTAIEGSFSRMKTVTLDDDQKIVVQYRLQAPDTTYWHRARRLLGAVVPEIYEVSDDELGDTKAFTYIMPFIPSTP
jgi:hypothetical protein